MAVYTVTTTADGGTGSLRDAITQANAAGGTSYIAFTLPANSTITLSSALPAITGNLTIDGNSYYGSGSPGLTIDGGGASRVFFVGSGNVTIESLTIAHGNATGGAGGAGAGGGLGAGGAVFVDAGQVTLTDVDFTGNRAAGGTGGYSGGNGYAGGGGGLGGAGTDGGGSVGGNGGGSGTSVGGPGGGGGSHNGSSGGDLSGGGGGNPGANGRAANPGGAGGYGGGGGAAGAYSPGGTGGFGGGGGAGSFPFVYAPNHALDYPTTPGQGGVGGGAGLGDYGGGGGAAFGGAVFVRAGASLVIGTSSGSHALSGDGVTAGTSQYGGGAGAAVGSDLFLQSGTTTTLSAGYGTVLTFNGTIADDSVKSVPGGQSYTAGSGAGANVAIGSGGSGGTVVFAGAAAYAGSTTINSGSTLKTAVANVFGTGTPLTVYGTLDLDGTNQALISLSGHGTITDSSGQYRTTTVTVGANGSYFDGTIKDGGSYAGIVALTVSAGSGALTLYGQNSYSGATTVQAGARLNTYATNSLSAASSVSDNGTLDLQGYSQTIASLSGSGTVTSSSGTAAILTEGNYNSSSFSGTIQDGGYATIGLTVTGYGTLTLTGTDTYSGTTTIAGSTTLKAGSATALSARSATTVNGYLDLGGYAATVNVLQGYGTVVSSAATTLTVGGGNASFTFSGSIQGAVSLVKAGSGTLTMAGAYYGTGSFTISAGTVVTTGYSALASLTTNNATIDLAGHGQSLDTLGGSGIVTNSGTAAATLTIEPNNSATLANILKDGAGQVGLAKYGSGTLTLTGGNSYTGATTVSGGTVKAGSANAFGVNSAVTDTATIDLAGYSETIGSLANYNSSGTVTNTAMAAATLTVGGLNTSTRFAGTITDGTGTIALVKTGTGTLTLAGSDSYSGGTTISGGTLAVSADGGLGAAAGGVTFNGGTLEATAGFTSARAVALAGAGTIQVDAAGTLVLSGPVSGAGSLTKSGTGTLTLAGGDAYSGGTTFAGGTLAVRADGGLGTATGGLTFNGGTLDATAGFTSTRAVALTGAGTVQVDGADNTLTLSGAVTGAGSLTKTGSGTLTLTGGNGYTGATIVSAGTLQAGSASAFGSNSAVTDNAVLDLRHQSTTLGSLAGSGMLLSSGVSATLTIGGLDTSTTFSGSIASTGSLDLVKTGSGTLTLTGSNHYVGGTTLAGGTLAIGADAALGSDTDGGDIASGGAIVFTGGTLEATASFADAHAMALNAAAAIQIDGAATMLALSGSLTGAGSLSKTGDGTLSLSAVNVYMGGTTIVAGVLELVQTTSAGTGPIMFATGHQTLRIDAALGDSGQFGDTLASVDYGDQLDLRGLAYASDATATVSGSALTVTSGGVSNRFTLSGNTISSFVATSDGHGGVLVTEGARPTITGTVAGQTTTSEAAISPFASVTIGDSNPGATESLLIQLGGAGGTLSGSGLMAGPIVGTSYILTGSADVVTSELRALSFTPAGGQPNYTGTTIFTLKDTSSAADDDSTSDNATTVTDHDPAVGSIIVNTTQAQASTAQVLAHPFANAVVTDTNVGGVTETLTITLSGNGGTLGGDGLTVSGDGSYTLTGSATDVTSKLQALAFTPDAAGVANGSVVTHFALSDVNSVNATASTDNSSQVTETDAAVAPTIAGTGGVSSTSEAAVSPFAGITVTDTNSTAGGDTASTATDTLTITLSSHGGTLSGAGLSEIDATHYALTGTGADVTGHLQALSFTPDAGDGPNSSVVTTFTLGDSSSAGTMSAAATSTATDSDPAVGSAIVNTTAAESSANRAAVHPFADAVVMDRNAGGVTETLTITRSGNGGTLTGSGLVDNGDGSHTLTGSAADVTSALQALSFTPDGTTMGDQVTHFLLTDTNSADTTPATDTTSQVTALDTTAPLVTVQLANDTSGGSGVTSDRTLAGTAEAGAMVTLSEGSAVIAGVPVNGEGTWRFEPGLPDGPHTLIASETDADGNTGSAAVSFVLDTAAPAAPAVTLAHDTGASGTDGLTSDATLTVVPAESGGKLAYSVDGAAYAASYNPAMLTDGQHVVTVTQTDLAGNVSQATSLAFTIDATAPGAPSGITFTGDGTALAPRTDIHAFVITESGTAEADAVVTLTAAHRATMSGTLTATVLATTVADASGHWSSSFSTDDLSGHVAFTATATDAAGNVGVGSTGFMLDITHLLGTNGDDVLTAPDNHPWILAGGKGDDTLTGAAGSDTLNGGVGADHMAGGLGNDHYYVDNLLDTVTENAGEGNDVVYSTVDFDAGGNSIETIVGRSTAGQHLTASNIDTHLIGGAGNDILTGGTGSDILSGGAGADRMMGGAGNDTYYVDNPGDTVVEAAGAGTDKVYAMVDYSAAGQSVEAIVARGTTGLALTGGTSAVKIYGGAGDDVLTGGALKDTLIGGAGDDRLVATTGHDLLTGGDGADTFVLSMAASGVNIDPVLTDFASGTDHVALSAAEFMGSQAGSLDPAAFRTNTTGKAESADDRFIYNSHLGALYYDDDGTGADHAVLIAQFTHAPTLLASDFVFA